MTYHTSSDTVNVLFVTNHLVDASWKSVLEPQFTEEGCSFHLGCNFKKPGKN